MLVKDQKILNQKIQQTKNDCQKTLHVVHQTKVHGINDVIRKIFIGNQVQHMKDIFVYFKETKREEALLRFFGKVLTKFKKRRISAAVFRQLKRKLEIKRLAEVAHKR